MNNVVKVGDKAPLWTAQGIYGAINSAEYVGNTPILLIFYQADWVNICTDELPLLEEMIYLAGKINLKAFGVSADSPACHKAFADEIGLRAVTLISENNREVSRLFGMLDDNNETRRGIILIDAEGIVRWVRLEPDHTSSRPSSELEKAMLLVRGWSGLSPNLEDWKREREYAMQLPRETPLDPPNQLQLRFWGTRGSIPVSGKDHLRYGGNTSCVSLMSDTGHLFIFDCGSGARELGIHLMANGWPLANAVNNKDVKGYILLSHTHWDHIQGFPFFTPVFKPGNHFHVIGWSNCSQTLASILAGQMQQCYFPVSLDSLASDLTFYSLQHNPVIIDEAKLTGQLLKHPIPSTAYRLEIGGKSIVYATDHEPHKVPTEEAMHTGDLLGIDIIDQNLVELATDADILIHDAQYSVEELGIKVGWGHNSSEVAVDTAIRARVKTLVLYHHDPAHNDDAIDELLEAGRRRARFHGNHTLKVVAAHDGMIINL